MKQYRVKVTDDAKADLRRYRDYLIKNKKSPQAARNVVLDFRETRQKLENTAGSLADPESHKLVERGLKRINFSRHDYFLLYRIENDIVYITNMFHSLEDYENKLR